MFFSLFTFSGMYNEFKWSKKSKPTESISLPFQTHYYFASVQAYIRKGGKSQAEYENKLSHHSRGK